jgi:hypothetical protein
MCGREESDWRVTTVDVEGKGEMERVHEREHNWIDRNGDCDCDCEPKVSV